MKVIIHILLVFLILLNSTGITLNKHFCKNSLKGIAIFTEPQNCHNLKKCSNHSIYTSTCCSIKNNHLIISSDAKKPCQHLTQKKSNQTNNCCHNESEWIKNNAQIISNFIHLYQPDINFSLILSAPVFIDKLKNTTHLSSLFNIKYDFPHLHHPLYKWVQSFLC